MVVAVQVDELELQLEEFVGVLVVEYEVGKSG